MLICAWILIGIGCFFLLSSIVGMYRMQSFYAKVHAAGVNDSLGSPLIVSGIALLQPTWGLTFKVLLLGAIAILLGPLVTHTLAHVAWLTQDNTHDN